MKLHFLSRKYPASAISPYTTRVRKTTVKCTLHFTYFPGNKEAGKAKENPENVYLFYDDFSDPNLEKKWQKNWGAIDVENGVLKLKTGENPTENVAGVSAFVLNGHEWNDIEVELDFNEIRNDVAPGPLVRVQDTRIQSLSAWWFEYISGSKDCTMRPYKNNRDGGWLYRGTLSKPLSQGSWNHAKYRVVGDRFVPKDEQIKITRH
jgi:hypothetical protein